MKTFKTISLLVLCIFFFSSLHAQMALGLRTGVNLATINGDEDGIGDDLERKLGLQAGLVFVSEINDLLSIQTELSLVQKGYSVKIDNRIDGVGDVLLEAKVNLNYLEIPVLARIAVGEGTRFFATFGPTFGFAASGKIKQRNVILGDTRNEETKIDFDDSSFNRFDMGLSLGAGGLFNIGGGDLFIDVRYLQGLTDLSEDADDVSIRNSGIGLSIGFLANISE